MGRPSKYNSAAVDKIVQAIKLGLTYEHAAAHGGVDYATFARWRKQFREFCEAVDRAAAEGALVALARIHQAMSDDWRAAAWLLEHRYPESYGRQALTATEAKTKSDEPVVITISQRYINDWRHPEAELSTARNENKEKVVN